MYNYYGDDMKLKIRLWVKILLFLIVVVTSFFTIVRYIGPKGLVTNEFSIINKNIPDSFYGYKIVHFGDIHYKVTTDLTDLNNIAKEINKIKPDIVIFSGDLFDHNIKYTKEDYEELTNFMKSINYNIGKFAIKGEEDSNKKWDEILRNSDFVDLSDSYKLLYNNSNEPILLTGISSKNIKEKVESINKEIDVKYNYSILVLHNADYINGFDYSKYNLILAGHNHGGQIRIPFIGGIIYDKNTIYKDSYYKLKNTELYITSGIGCSKYKFRFLNKPSINLYRLRNS